LNSVLQRQLAGLYGFAVVAAWIGLGLVATLLCLLAAAGSYFVARRLQQRRLDQLTSRHFERTARPRREVERRSAPPSLRRASSV
jgi:biopolymer transport protein ExbB/TolQ